MRRLLGMLGWCDVVWVCYDNGQYCLRIAHYLPSRASSPFDDKLPPISHRWIAYGIVRSRIGVLGRGGLVEGGSYMKFWKPFRVKSPDLLALYESGATKQ